MEGGEKQMFNLKFLTIVSLSVMLVLVGYSSTTFGISKSCLSMNVIGCMKVGGSCLMLCDVSIDDTYRLNSDIPILVVKERGSETVVSITEMTYVGTTEHCDEYSSRPEVSCDAPYDVYIYINDTGGIPILTAPVIVCPSE
jgi:hypothetical protein